MDNDFLPKGYDDVKIEKESDYMKMKDDGEYRIRFLSSPIVGIECWKNKKPLRFRSKDEVPNETWDINTFTGKPKSPVTFWAAIVWNYGAKRMQILSITQSTIQGAIEELTKDEDWGSPLAYDLKITRTTTDKTEYSVRPVVPSPLDPLIEAEYGMCKWKLEALFDGADPFAG